MSKKSVYRRLWQMLALYFLYGNLYIPVLHAQTQDDNNITLASSEETFTFEYDSKLQQVIVRQQTEKDFICNGFRSAIPYGETYNNQEEIKDIDIIVDGKRNRSIQPKCDYLNIDSYFYSDARICYFELPFTRQGSHSKVIIEKVIKDPRYLTTAFLAESYPVQEKKITVIVPSWMKADIHPYNFAGRNIQSTHRFDAEKDAHIYTYTASRMPAMQKNPMNPGPTWLWPHVMICSKTAEHPSYKQVYFNTLADQYNWYHSLVQQLKEDTAALDAKAKEITAGITGKWEQLKAIFYWVEENIRYIAFEDGIAGFKPDEAHEVMRKKYGDCKGMANLTRALLQRCGFDARLCWIGTNHLAYDYSIPSLCIDNHMICAVKYNNRWWFLDATEGFMQPGIYAERIQGRQVLIENGSNYLLENIPATTAAQNSRTFKEELYVNGTSMTGKVTYEYNGENKTDLLHNIHRLKKDRLQTALENYITNRNSRYQISNVTTSSLEQRDGNLQVSFDLVYQDAVSAFGREMYIDIDYNKEFNNAIIDTVKRLTDIRFSSKDNYITETALVLPEGYRAATLPEDLHIVHPKFTFNISYKVENNRIYYRKQLTINNTYLLRAEFGAWNNAVAALSRKYLEQITLEKKPDNL